MLADILPTGYEVGVRNGHVQPGDVVAVVGAGPIGLAAILGARLYSPTHIVAIDLADSRLEAAKHLRRRHRRQQQPRGRARRRPRADRRPRRRRRHRSGRRARHLRAGDPARPARGSRRQHRRPRRARHPPPRGPLEPQRHHHHRPRRHLLHADPARARPQPAARRRPLRDPPLPARRHGGRLRHLRRRRRRPAPSRWCSPEPRDHDLDPLRRDRARRAPGLGGPRSVAGRAVEPVGYWIGSSRWTRGEFFRQVTNAVFLP